MEEIRNGWSASFSLRANEYLEAKIEHVLVDPGVNFVYTRRKRRLLSLEDALDPNTPNSSTPSDNTKKVAFPTDGWGSALAKSPLLTCAEMDRHIICLNSGKKHQTREYHLLPTGLRKAKAFLADEYLHEIQTHQDQSYFYYRAKCFHSFKVREEPHNLKLALCIVSLLFTEICAIWLYCLYEQRARRGEDYVWSRSLGYPPWETVWLLF